MFNETQRSIEGIIEENEVKKILKSIERKPTIQLMTSSSQCIANASQKIKSPTFPMIDPGNRTCRPDYEKKDEIGTYPVASHLSARP